MALRVGLDIANFGSGVSAWPVDEAIREILGAERDGLDCVWVPQLGGGSDPLTTCALATLRTSSVQLATGVVPVWGHHPVEIARAALTVGAASGGRFVLGLGVSHRHVAEPTYGTSFARPARYAGEYLAIVRSLLTTGEVDFSGVVLQAQARLDLAGAHVVPIGLAAGGPAMLDVAGRYADVAITNMVGPRTLQDYTMPALIQGSSRASRKLPRIAVAASICITDDVVRSRDHIDEVLANYARFPAYRAMLNREGVDAPSAVAVVGSEAVAAEKLAELDDLGVTDLIASVKTATDEDYQRTRHFLRSYATGRE